ncbi:hypothetical protein [Neisseria iguanae]|uniref:Uncharacterized protein n=1 Tax=Neisseria iguanae TaxID=90242 RepID=A0A2P7U0L0_9NEIS|nr:hypothetical protein [Neisseria iguanae]PSJ80520.1 hypothetical protein C7N83_05695 [Neisseria iguanae]
MLRGILIFCALLVPLSALAQQRDIPHDMHVAILKQVRLPYVKLSNGGFSWLKILTLGLTDGNSATVQVSRMARIKDENDRYIVMGRLTAQAGKTVAVRRDGSGLIREIWILSDDEVAKLAVMAE